MPKPKRRKNLFGFGGKKSSGNYIPASGGIAAHSAKRRASKASSAAPDSKLDDVAKSLAKGKKYASLSSSEQAMVRRVASKMNPKRRKNLFGFGSVKKAVKRREKGYMVLDELGHPVHTGSNLTKKEALQIAKAERADGGKARLYKHNPKRKRNIGVGLPKNQFVNAKVRMKGGKIQVMADERVLGKAGFKARAGLRGVSVSGGAKPNPRKKRKSNPDARKQGLRYGKAYAQRLNKAAGVFDPIGLAKSKAKEGVRRLGSLNDKLSYERAFLEAFRETFRA